MAKEGFEMGIDFSEAVPDETIFQRVLPNALVCKSDELFAQARKSALWTL